MVHAATVLACLGLMCKLRGWHCQPAAGAGAQTSHAASRGMAYASRPRSAVFLYSCASQTIHAYL